MVHHPELLALRSRDEELDVFQRTRPQEMLLKWVNYHLVR